MLRWICGSTFGRAKKSLCRKPGRSSRRLSFEGLEPRQVLAGGLTATLANGVLAITGTEQADTIVVRQIDNRLSIDGLSGSYAVNQVNKIVVDARGGDDTVNLNSGAVLGQQPIKIPAVIFGGSGADTIFGTAANDYIVGDDDLDLRNGLAGDFNGDGKSDLVFLRQINGLGLVIHTKFSNGDGTWSSRNQVLGDGSGVHTYPTLTGDFNGDGKTDLVFVGQNWSGSGLNIRTKFSNGDGTWRCAAQVLGDGSGVHMYPTLTGDFNGDGKTDLAFVFQHWNGSGFNIRTKFARGDGTWAPVHQVLPDGADTLFGGWGCDTLYGGPGNDILYGNNADNSVPPNLTVVERLTGDRDTLYGGDGNDTLYGQHCSNVLYGGNGNDRLIGGEGPDQLNGGAGNDGLIGSGRSELWGGAGADRFLVQNGLAAKDVTPEDARIDFVYGNRVWRETEILQVDDGLARLHARTNNTKLLKLSNGEGLRFERWSTIPNNPNAAADNSSGLIRFADSAFAYGPAWAWQVAIHEIGHNWDDESPFWTSFLAISGWTWKNPNSSQYTRTTRYGQTWWYLTASEFVSDYAKSHPMEDFAESFEYYFRGSWAGISNARFVRDPGPLVRKMMLIDRLLNALS